MNQRAEEATHPVRQGFASLREHPDITVLIVGGGINGIGLFRELSLQGVNVLLVEKSDFCAGRLFSLAGLLRTRGSFVLQHIMMRGSHILRDYASS